VKYVGRVGVSSTQHASRDVTRMTWSADMRTATAANRGGR